MVTEKYERFYYYESLKKIVGRLENVPITIEICDEGIGVELSDNAGRWVYCP